jgi:hypothetical protein
MASKEVMLTAPIVVLLYDRAFLFDGWREIWATPWRRRLHVALVPSMGLSIFLVATDGRSQTGIRWPSGRCPS